MANAERQVITSKPSGWGFYGLIETYITLSRTGVWNKCEGVEPAGPGSIRFLPTAYNNRKKYLDHHQLPSTQATPDRMEDAWDGGAGLNYEWQTWSSTWRWCLVNSYIGQCALHNAQDWNPGAVCALIPLTAHGPLTNTHMHTPIEGFAGWEEGWLRRLRIWTWGLDNAYAPANCIWPFCLRSDVARLLVASRGPNCALDSAHLILQLGSYLRCAAGTRKQCDGSN